MFQYPPYPAPSPIPHVLIPTCPQFTQEVSSISPSQENTCVTFLGLLCYIASLELCIIAWFSIIVYTHL